MFYKIKKKVIRLDFWSRKVHILTFCHALCSSMLTKCKLRSLNYGETYLKSNKKKLGTQKKQNKKRNKKKKSLGNSYVFEAFDNALNIYFSQFMNQLSK